MPIQIRRKIGPQDSGVTVTVLMTSAVVSELGQISRSVVIGPTFSLLRWHSAFSSIS